MTLSTTELIVHVTVHRPSGRAIVTGPRDGIWERLAHEANPNTSWNRDWGGWTLDTLNQVADLCTLADIHGAIFRESDWRPGLLEERKARRRERAQKGRRR